MPDQPIIAAPGTPDTNAALAGRVAVLARLIEAHPAFDLLAEYEALFIDRHPCASETVSCLTTAAADLAGRIEATIATLEAAMAPETGCRQGAGKSSSVRPINR